MSSTRLEHKMSTCLVLDICIKISHVEHSKVDIFSGRSRMVSWEFGSERVKYLKFSSLRRFISRNKDQLWRLPCDLLSYSRPPCSPGGENPISPFRCVPSLL